MLQHKEKFGRLDVANHVIPAKTVKHLQASYLWPSVSSMRTALTMLIVIVFSAPGHALENKCTKDASLWLPSDNTSQSIVAKWNRAIRYAVISGDEGITTDRALASEKAVEEELAVIAEKARIQIISKSSTNDDIRSVDLLIAVVSDLTLFAPKLRELAQVFLQSKAETAHGTIKIDAVAWEQENRKAVPKCSGINLRLGGEIVSAFALVQDDQQTSCIAVDLGELFGLINIRRDYISNGQSISADQLASALQSLYSTPFDQG